MKVGNKLLSAFIVLVGSYSALGASGPTVARELGVHIQNYGVTFNGYEFNSVVSSRSADYFAELSQKYGNYFDLKCLVRGLDTFYRDTEGHPHAGITVYDVSACEKVLP